MPPSTRSLVWALLTCFALPMTGCSNTSPANADPTPAATQSAMLTTPRWRMTAYTLTSIEPNTSPTTRDIFASILPCIKDNFIKFNTNYTYVDDAGADLCQPPVPQTVTWAWAFKANSNESQLVMNTTYTVSPIREWQIDELNATTLKLTETVSSAGQIVQVYRTTYSAF